MTFRGFDEQEQAVVQMVLQNGRSMTSAKEALRSFRRLARLEGNRETQRQRYLTILRMALGTVQEQEGN